MLESQPVASRYPVPLRIRPRHRTRPIRPVPPLASASLAPPPPDLSPEVEHALLTILAQLRRRSHFGLVRRSVSDRDDALQAGAERILRMLPRFDPRRGKLLAAMHVYARQGAYQERMATKGAGRPERLQADAKPQGDVSLDALMEARAEPLAVATPVSTDAIDARHSTPSLDDILAYCIERSRSHADRLTEHAIVYALFDAGGSQAAAARALGVNRSVVSKFLARFRLRLPAHWRGLLL